MRYLVESLFLDQWIEHGSVLLPPGASAHQVEAALTAVGVFAPRGQDELDWVVPYGAPEQVFSALIFDMHGEVIVKLIAAEEKGRTMIHLDHAQRYAKLAARLLEKAVEAQARGEHALAEARAESAQHFLGKATKALVDGPTIQKLMATSAPFAEPWEPCTPHKDEALNRWLALEYIRKHRLPADFCERRELLDPKTHEECIANGWLVETTPGVWTWDFEQLDRDMK